MKSNSFSKSNREHTSLPPLPPSLPCTLTKRRLLCSPATAATPATSAWMRGPWPGGDGGVEPAFGARSTKPACIDELLPLWDPEVNLWLNYELRVSFFRRSALFVDWFYFSLLIHISVPFPSQFHSWTVGPPSDLSCNHEQMAGLIHQQKGSAEHDPLRSSTRRSDFLPSQFLAGSSKNHENCSWSFCSPKLQKLWIWLFCSLMDVLILM